MAASGYNNDNLSIDDYEAQKLPSGINILTILTFIGTGIGLLFSIYGFISSRQSYENREKVMEQMSSSKMPAWAKSFMPDMAHFEQMVTNSYNNRIPILLLALIAAALCIAGAVQMRKRKKQGFLLYTIGELLPFVSLAFFVGFFALSGVGFYVSVFFAVLFILLYSFQRKYLTK